jgi:hypothetical protein
MWNDTHIFVLVEVTDDAPVHDDSSLPYLDDSAELYLDGGHEQAGSYDSNDYQLTVDINNDFGGVRSDQLAFEHAASIASSSYAIEYAVPFSALGAVPSDGLVMGFDVGVNDDDDGGETRESQIVWHGNGTVWKYPYQMGDIELVVTHRADTDRDGCVDTSEIDAFINLWYQDSTEYPMGELMEAVGLWKTGSGCP